MSFSGIKLKLNSSMSDRKRDSTLTVPEDITAIYDINYAGNHDKYNLLDIYYPRGTARKLPVIVSFHGGGYVYGTKKVYKYYGMYMAKQGFVFVNFNYHLAPKHKFPTQLRECNMVLEWMSQHADEYYMDLDNVFMVGDSAGAQMCSQYAAIASNPKYEELFPFRVPRVVKLKAIGLNCGMYKPKKYDPDQKTTDLLNSLYGDLFGKNPYRMYKNFDEMIDVLGHITSNYPPAYIMTSYYDFLKEEAEPMYCFLKAQGVDTEWKCYGSADKEYMAHVCHVNMNLNEAREINNDECTFFRRYIKNVDKKSQKNNS